MPSRSPLSLTPSSSTSSSASSSFIPYSSFGLHNREPNNTSLSPTGTPTSAVTNGLTNLGGLASLSDNDRQSLGSSLSSSRDEHEHLSYTPIYPSYSSSFSNSSLEFHESLLLAIRERQQQQQQQQQLQQLQLQHQYQHQHQHQSRTWNEHPTNTVQGSNIVLEPSITAFIHSRHSEGQPFEVLGALEQNQPPNTTLNQDLEIEIDSLQITGMPERTALDNTGFTSLLTQDIQTEDGSSAEQFTEVINRAQNRNRNQGMNAQAEAQSRIMESSWPSRRNQLLPPSPSSSQPTVNDNGRLPQSNASEPIIAPIRSIGSPSLNDGERARDQNNDNIVQEAYAAQSLFSPDNRSGNEAARREEAVTPSVYSTLSPNEVATAQQPCPSDTQATLSQTLTSFQGASLNQSFVNLPITTPIDDRTAAFSQNDDVSDIDIAIAMTPMSTSQSDIVPNLNVHPSTQMPMLPLTSQDESTSTMDEFVEIPRALPRRRYATRDYSSSSVSSDDWLHHPDVVAFANRESAASEVSIEHVEYRLPDQENSDPIIENQENIPPQPLTQISGATIEYLPETSLGFTPTASLTILTTETPYTPIETHGEVQPEEQGTGHVSHVHDVQEVQQVIQSMQDLAIGESSVFVDTTITSPIIVHDISSEGRTLSLMDQQSTSQIEPESTSASESLTETNQLDRLGLLGPLLSNTRATSTTSYEDAFDFSLLGSTRPGFDSSILSMASRIRQARLTRILRRMRERDTLAGYPERHTWIDSRSMINHTSGSRGTSRAGSLEDNFMDLGPDVDSRDAMTENQESTQNHDLSTPLLLPSQAYPAPPPFFTEILDCNGNSIEWGNNHNTSASSNTSQETTEERNEELRWTRAAEIQRQRRASVERSSWGRGIIHTQGRSRILSTGTAFEGMEFISEADSFLTESHYNQSLKSSWVTNPNGECWSDDDDAESPLRRRHGGDIDDKDHETEHWRRGQPSLGVLQSNSQYQGAVGTGFYQLYSNVRNSHRPENSRRRRVMSEMTDLLRREQNWEREFEQYERELSAFRSGLISRMESRPLDGSASFTSTFASHPSATTVGEGTDVMSLSTDTGNMNDHSSRAETIFGHQEETIEPLWQRTDANEQNDSIVSEPAQGFFDYEQGNSHYHSQSMSFHAQSGRSNDSNRQLPQQQQQELLHYNQPTQYQSPSIARQPTVAMMNRAPPPLPTQPLINEPIAHQIRRAHTPHMLTLQRRWETQQLMMHQHQASLNRQAQQQQRQLSTSSSTIATSDYHQPHQRYSSSISSPSPTQQELRNDNPFSSATSVGSIPLSRGIRSSFRSSHEINNGFQQFQLSGGNMPPLLQSATSSSSTASSATHQVEIPASTMATDVTSGIDLATNSVMNSARLPTFSSMSSEDLAASGSSQFTLDL
ncbi:hypothetical protein BGZ49_010631, partial [Haplosporangium sp. Z 27]